MTRLGLLNFFIETYVSNSNLKTVAFENYLGKDYDTGYHEIVEVFSKIGPILNNGPLFSKISDVDELTSCAVINTANTNTTSSYSRFITKLADKAIKRYNLSNPSIITKYMNRLNNYINKPTVDINAVKELRKIEEELDDI